jgi:hypothetical protein
LPGRAFIPTYSSFVNTDSLNSTSGNNPARARYQHQQHFCSRNAERTNVEVRLRLITAQSPIPGKVAADKAYQNAMKNSDKAAARLEHDRALQKVVIGMLADHTELFKQFSDNPSFKKWLADTIFNVTYDEGAA